MTGARRISLAILATGLIAAATSETASATEICSPTPKVSTSFCVDPSLVLSSSTAGSPLSVDLSANDTSTNFTSDTNEWVQTLAIDLTSSSAAPAQITPSASMPDTLRIANSPSCTSPTFTDCAAGHGVFAGVVSGSGIYDGYHEGYFGIDGIVNVADPGPGNLARYRVGLRYTITGLPFTGATETHIDVAAGTGAGGPLVWPTRIAINDFNPVHIDATLRSFSLHLDGQSSTLGDGSPAGQSYKVFSVSPTCGDWLATVTLTAGDGTRTLSLDQGQTVTGCAPPASTSPVAAPTGRRAAALKKCKKKKGRARKNCIKRAKKLPV